MGHLVCPLWAIISLDSGTCTLHVLYLPCLFYIAHTIRHCGVWGEFVENWGGLVDCTLVWHFIAGYIPRALTMALNVEHCSPGFCPGAGLAALC